MKALRIILWDHLSHDVSSLSDLDMQTDTILMCETVDDCTHVKHHKKKLVFLLSAMRHFAQ
ncbi:MAG: cryptochrome/photolyase family protein, partial [Candidatus Paracaedibacteraceae bacterium]|nr:cryptochrome/photolyase family protein [Candidatus Paracaedibacteraceae bacterium]